MLTHVHAQKRRRLRPRDQCSLCSALWPAWPTKVRAVRPCCPAHPFARARTHAHTHTHTHTHRRPAVVGDDAHQAPPALRQARGPALGQATWHHLCFSRSCLYCTQNVVLTAHRMLSLLHTECCLYCTYAYMQSTPRTKYRLVFSCKLLCTHILVCPHTCTHVLVCPHINMHTHRAHIPERPLKHTHTHTHRVDDKSDKLPEAEHGLSVSR
jgi:hypothetical protein